VIEYTHTLPFFGRFGQLPALPITQQKPFHPQAVIEASTCLGFCQCPGILWEWIHVLALLLWRAAALSSSL
jgi:hypothetical protein